MKINLIEKTALAINRISFQEENMVGKKKNHHQSNPCLKEHNSVGADKAIALLFVLKMQKHSPCVQVLPQRTLVPPDKLVTYPTAAGKPLRGFVVAHLVSTFFFYLKKKINT